VNILAMLLPWAPMLPAHQIWMGEHLEPVVAEKIEEPDRVMMAVSVYDFVRLKHRAESASGNCSEVISEAVGACQSTAHDVLQLTHDEATETQADQVRVIEALRIMVADEKEKTAKVEEDNEVLKWVAVGTGVVALSAVTTLAVTLR